MACYNLPVHDIAQLGSPDVVHLCREEDNVLLYTESGCFSVSPRSLPDCLRQ